MKKIVITFSIVLLGCLAANAQSNAPVMAAGKAGNTQTQPVVGASKPQMAAYKPGNANRKANTATSGTAATLTPAAKQKMKPISFKKG
jgi:hypothetical protein